MALSMRNLFTSIMCMNYRITRNCFHVSSVVLNDNQTLTVCDQNKNGLRRIHLNNPKKRNALSLAMLEKMVEDLSMDHTNLKCVVISGEGSVFSSGHDLRELTPSEGQKYHQQVFDKCTQVMKLIREVPAPVIAEIDGMAAAAGCQLVAACDMAIATERSKFSTPGVSVGLFCSTPGVAVARSIHKKAAMDMLFTGRPITAQEALLYGLVSRVVPDGELKEQMAGITTRICELSQPVATLGKQFFYKQIEMSLDDAYIKGGAVMVHNLTLRDTQEGIDAFFKKRHPQWKHTTDKVH